MDWVDALKISTLILASLGGGGGIVLALARFLGQKWLQEWKGDIDAKLQRLDAALAHRNYLLQRLAEFELEAITECWRAARACLPLINATRPLDSGTDETVLQANLESLSDGHNKLIDAIGRHEMFLSREVIGTLDEIGRVLRLELSSIRHHEHFAGSWWDDGQRNRNQFQQLCSTLLNQVKTRAGELRADVSSESRG
ncbi:MAG: hypothetical protein ACE5I9_02995 [Candidatus Methylomirabilales bacterium]